MINIDPKLFPEILEIHQVGDNILFVYTENNTYKITAREVIRGNNVGRFNIFYELQGTANINITNEPEDSVDIWYKAPDMPWVLENTSEEALRNALRWIAQRNR